RGYRVPEFNLGGWPMVTRRKLLTASAAGLAFSAMGLVRSGFAQSGGKTARILVGFPAGGTVDFVARLLANEIKDYSSAVVVENPAGPSAGAARPKRKNPLFCWA